MDRQEKSQPPLSPLRVTVVVMGGVEEAELTEPVKALTTAGALVDVISQNRGTMQAFRHHTPSI
jgi:protease I